MTRGLRDVSAPAHGQRHDGAMTPPPLACPRCGEPDLESGLIVGRSPGVKFKRHRGLAGDLTGIRLTQGIFNHSAPALRCGTCGTVVVTPEH